MKTSLERAAIRLAAEGEVRQEWRERVVRGLQQANQRACPHFAAAYPPEGGPAPLEVFALDAQGRVVGGVLAATIWTWLRLESLWVDQGSQRRGIGRRLIAAAEAEAICRGCRAAEARTFSFQALGFYRALGFDIVGQLEDFPPGETLFWVRKELVPSAASPSAAW